MLAAERADVTVVADGLETRRPVATVQAGEVVRIRPGERIGVDGLVTDGHSECDESILTGQPDPRPKSRGDRVHAGSLNGAGQLWVRATRPGSQTRWIQISRLVREALARKSLVGETLDRVAAWFIPGVLLLAIATMGFWAARGNFSDALLTGFAVLVVACPCSLALAAPLATALGIARAAARGILIRGGGVLERLACVRGIAFDKTGTLTSGVPSVASLETAGTATPDDVLRRAHPLAQGSDHPLARAIVAFGERAGLVAAPAAEIRTHPGVGVTGLVEGVPCAMGSARLMSALAWPVPRALAAPLPAGTTQVYVGWEGRPRARFVLADEPRPEAQTVVTTLRGQGLETLLLSGDGTRAVAPLAGALGIRTWHAGLSPEAKVKQILHWAESHGPVAMVGDGLNDGPVLASAAVGIAVGDATDLAKESADVIMPTGGLAALPWLVQLARDVRRCVRINLAWAFGYNAVALALAASGYLQPVVAAALMAGSSLLVVARTLRTARTGREREPTRARTEPPPRIADARGLEA